MSELIGQEIAGFRIVREIARGGMGIVFEAEQVRLGRTVALKMLHPALTHDRDFLKRFEREAKTLARLNHENIINVIDFFREGDRWFLALEFVEGETLARRLRRCARMKRFFSVGEAARIVWQVAQALAFAHRRKIVHRDLKPENIMLTPRGRAKVMDFGIARIAGAGESETGSRIGTPDYMSPEQLKGREAGVRSDLFSLGVIFYEMIAGRRPYSQSDLLGEKSAEVRLPWDEGSLPPGSERVRPIIEKLLALEPKKRYPSAAKLLEDLRERLGTEMLGDEAWTVPPHGGATAESPTPPSRALSWAKRSALVAALILIVVGALFYHRWQQNRFDLQQKRLEATMANFQAFIADSQGRRTEAEHLFLRAIDVDPSVAHYWRDLGDFYVKWGQPEKAVYYYRKTLELDSSDTETARRLRAIEEGKPIEAEKPAETGSSSGGPR